MFSDDRRQDSVERLNQSGPGTLEAGSAQRCQQQEGQPASQLPAADKGGEDREVQSPCNPAKLHLYLLVVTPAINFGSKRRQSLVAAD